MKLPVGTIVERYVIEGIVGEGGMATVYLARHSDLGSTHAIKLMHRSSGSIGDRLLQEGRLQSSLVHPNVVAVTDMVYLAGSPGLVMEYVQGPTLHQFLERHILETHQADALARGILRGVVAAHRHGLVHRDLKPANILLSLADGRIVPKITDFGLAKVLRGDADRVHQTRTGASLGTPGYMSPEQISDASTVDERADVFSLGAILYELVTGELAFGTGEVMSVWNRISRGEYASVQSRRPHLESRMLQAIEGALVVDRDDRIPSASRLLEVWSRGSDNAPPPTLPPDDADLWSGAALYAAENLINEISGEISAQQESASSGDPALKFQASSGGSGASSPPRATRLEVSAHSGSYAGDDSPEQVRQEAVQTRRLAGLALALVVSLGAWIIWQTPEGSEEPPSSSGPGEPGASRTTADGLDASASTAAEAICGNGEKEGSEACDDGNTADGDICTSTCTSNVLVVGGGAYTRGFRPEELEAGLPFVVQSASTAASLMSRAQWAAPDTTVQVNWFSIMRTEVSVEAMRLFIHDDGPGRLLDGGFNYAPEVQDWYLQTMESSRAKYSESIDDPHHKPRYPVMVDRRTAVAFCAWLGGRLPVEDEWEFAARGPLGERVFPWEGERIPQKSPEDCDLISAFYHVSRDPIVTFNCGGRMRAPIGSHPAGCTPEGLCDMSGSVDEFVLPGSVVWEEVQESDSESYWAAMPVRSSQEVDDLSASAFTACAGRGYSDPYGLVSGMVSDCIRGTSYDILVPEKSYPADRAYGIVRGGNYDDSAPLFYQTRGRYPFFAPEGQRGLRCVVSLDVLDVKRSP